MYRAPILSFAGAALVLISGCYSIRPATGGGEIPLPAERRLDPADVALPPGYRIEVVASGLNFPTGVAFDESGRVYVTESGYSYGEVFTVPRLLEIRPGSEPRVVASGGKNGPWNGVTHANGIFYVAEGGVLEGGRILAIDPDGTIKPLVTGLPSHGDHHTNGPISGDDGWLYFGQGTATNSGIVGPDNAAFGWLARHPGFHDRPCADVTLTGANYASSDPASGRPVSTGAYLPYGTSSSPGQVIPGGVPCSGAVLRISPSGGTPELVAWGFRNPFGLAFDATGTLYVTDNAYDERGSRPLWGTADVLWRFERGRWYGWPDYAEGLKAGERFKAPGAPEVRSLLAAPPAPGEPPRPTAEFPVHASADGVDIARGDDFGYRGQAFVALFGDQVPTVGKLLAPVGFKVVRADLETGIVEDFATNRSAKSGPASRLGSGGLERPLAVRFDPRGTALYVVDFGIMAQLPDAKPIEHTGVLWRITREGAR